MQSITLNLETNLSPIDLEALTKSLKASATRWIRKREKKQEPKLSDFFGMFGSDPETANMTHKELKDYIMRERFGI